MLYLSLIELPRSDRRWRFLTPYEAHQLIWRAFPGQPRGERPFLFSLEERGSHHSLLVQSSVEPEWTEVGGAVSVRVKRFDPGRIRQGTRLRYFVRVNPTVARKGFSDGRTRRVAVGTNPAMRAERLGVKPEEVQCREESLAEWFVCRGELGGFRVDSCLPGPTVAKRILRPSDIRNRSRPITIHEVELTGVLRVEDPLRFAQVCKDGLGRARAFGYGLLMVRPL